MVHDLSEGFLLWEDVLKKYPLFEVKDEADDEEKNSNSQKPKKEKREKTPEKK